TLTEGVLNMMWFAKVKMLAALVVVMVLSGGGIGFLVHRAIAGGQSGGGQARFAEPLAKGKNAAPSADASAGEERQELLNTVKELRQMIRNLDTELKSAQRESRACEKLWRKTSLRSRKGRSTRANPSAIGLSSLKMPIKKHDSKP